MNILIVDDEALIRKALSRSLATLGYNVYEAENGMQALNILMEKNIEGLVLDIVMPEKNGDEVLKEFQEQIPVVIISAFTGEDLNSELFKNDPRVKAVIKKPFIDLFSTTQEIIRLLT